MNGFRENHEDHEDSCECALCSEWRKDFVREQDEDAAKELDQEKHGSA